MGQMSWLSYLVDTKNEKELVEFLKGKGFKDPKFAAKEFLKAGEDLETLAKLKAARLEDELKDKKNE
jgi:hypothetical protein|tara:strand:+ start:261 stop:461 length:201 start_codon:yes stop_codon:yes gene_type:complete